MDVLVCYPFLPAILLECTLHRMGSMFVLFPAPRPWLKSKQEKKYLQKWRKGGSQGRRWEGTIENVPQDEWTGYTPRGKDDEIPCRRMRSGSYIKAMGDEDSGDSDTSPKPSPKVAARRESYLKATQPSLTELTTLKTKKNLLPEERASNITDFSSPLKLARRAPVFCACLALERTKQSSWQFWWSI